MNDSLSQHNLEETLAKAHVRLGELGCELSYQPSICFVDNERYASHVNAVAFRAQPFVQAYMQSYLRHVSKATWALGDIDMPDEAIDEAVQRTHTPSPLIQHDSDIGVFATYAALTPEKQERVLLHELWHLVELERDVQAGMLLIEGTATAAQYTGKPLPLWTLRDSPTIEQVRYFGAAHRVRDALKDEPFTTVLDPQWRTVVEKKHADDLVRFLSRNPERVQMNPISREWMLQFPPVQTFTTNATHENYVALAAFLYGEKTATALQNQDTTKLRHWLYGQLTATA